MSRHVPVRHQTTQTECGLVASLAILEHLGRFIPLHEARSVVDPGRNGLTGSRIRDLLTAYGCNVKFFRAGSARVADLQLPAIAHWHGDHFVVVERVGDKDADIMDPDAGRRRITREQFESDYSGVMITVERGEDFQPAKRKPFHYWRMPGLRWSLPRRELAVVAIITAATYAMSMSLPVVTARLVDAVSRGNEFQWSWLVVFACVIGVATIFVGAEALRTLFTSRIVRRLGYSMMESSFSHLLRLPLNFFSTRMSGELMQRLGGVNFVRDALSNRIVQSIFDIGMTVVILVYVWAVSPVLGVISTGLLLLFGVFLLATRSALTRAVDDEIDALMGSQGIQYDAVSSVAQLKMGGYTADIEQKWKSAYQRSLGALHRRMMWQMGAVGAVSHSFQIFGPLALLLIGIQMRDAVSLGQIVAVSSLASVMFSGVSGMLSTYTDVVTCTRYLAKLEDILGTKTEPTGGSRTKLDSAEIRIRNLSFSYAGEPRAVLDKIDMTIGEGDLVAVVGQSGSGKSTLGKIVCGLYETDQGLIEIGGHALGDYDRDALRRQIGYVPQDVTLHNGSVIENLGMGSDLDEVEIERRCRELEFLDFIDRLPMGYRTMVADLGANFSGGQRQRLAIARVLLRSPRIIVFDEATSALDQLNEQRVNRVLRSLGCTRIVIAHRLETVRGANTIHVLEDGRFVEQGTHDHLLESNGAYSVLYRQGVPA